MWWVASPAGQRASCYCSTLCSLHCRACRWVLRLQCRDACWALHGSANRGVAERSLGITVQGPLLPATGCLPALPGCTVQSVIGFQMVQSNYRSFLSPEGYLVHLHRVLCYRSLPPCSCPPLPSASFPAAAGPLLPQDLEAKESDLWGSRGVALAGLCMLYMAVMNFCGTLVSCRAWRGWTGSAEGRSVV